MIKIINGCLILLFLFLGIVNAQGLNTLKKNSADSSKVTVVKVKSPRKAMIYSLIFPGLGQLYNGKKLKALLFFSAEFGLLANSIYLNQKYKESVDPYSREFYINNRNLSTWWLVGTILFSTLDAFVDAHLYNFDESPDLSSNIRPDPLNKRILLSLSVSF